MSGLIDKLNQISLKVPIGIGTSMWSSTPDGAFVITFTLLHGINRVTRVVLLDKMYALMTTIELEHVVQMLADRTTLEMLHHLDEHVLKQPIIERLENALATMKVRLEDCGVYDPYPKSELKFFIEFIEGYVMRKPHNERYSNVK